jgi:hypothetical protein
MHDRVIRPGLSSPLYKPDTGAWSGRAPYMPNNDDERETIR